MKAMAKNPDDRYGSAEELRADLLRFADGRPVEAGDPGLTSMMTAVGGDPGRPHDHRAHHGRPRRRRAVPRARRTSSARSAPATSSSCWSCSWWRWPSSPSSSCARSGSSAATSTVPDVVGLTAGQATQTLQNDHLDRGQQHHAGRAPPTKGDVLSTDPEGGRLGGEELRGEPGRQRRPEHPHRRRSPR